jgi:signal transduction histidine kinase
MGAIPCAFLWPLYGMFCMYVLDLPEHMTIRWLLMLVFLGLGWSARRNRLGALGRWIWVAASSVGMVWLPWALYFESNRSDYWKLSIIFFSIGLSLSIRGPDFFLALLLGALGVIWKYNGLFEFHDIALLPVAGITMLATYLGVDNLRVARRRNAAQSTEIQARNQELMELHRRKDEFTASVAHDLRTPLAVAMSLSESLADTDLSTLSRKRLDSLIEALRQMRRQSEELLDLERFQLGVARLDPVVLDVCAWVRRFEEGFSSMARARGLTFQIILGERQMFARIDPIRMEAALFNLVSNAFKFTPPDGHVEVHVRRIATHGLSLSVLDDGEGIPSDALPHIFDRYQQVDRGPGTYTAGVGIGLALVREIAEIHGGRVQVQSTLGLGSLFEIVLENVLDDTPILPLATVPAPRSGQLHTNRPTPGGALILVVEDQQMLRHVIREVLERLGRVATARDGHEAIRLVHELRPDVVVTDVSMPGMDGLELLAALRSEPSTSGLPVVFLSGDMAALRTRLADDPSLALVPKPFEQAHLVAVVESFLTSQKSSGFAFHEESSTGV